MDSRRLLLFAIDQKLKLDQPSSYECINDLCQGKSSVEKIIKERSYVGLTALCDLLTILILAMDEYKRFNTKPTVGASNQSSKHKDMDEHGGSDKNHDGQKKETATSHKMEIGPLVLNILEKDFNNQKYSKIFAGSA